MIEQPTLLDLGAIDALFESADSQEDYIIGLYRLVFSDWDKIETVNGFPACSEKLSTYIYLKAIDWDSLHQPICGMGFMLGGGWMNNGFSASGHKGHWLEVHRCDVTYIK